MSTSTTSTDTLQRQWAAESAAFADLCATFPADRTPISEAMIAYAIQASELWDSQIDIEAALRRVQAEGGAPLVHGEPAYKVGLVYQPTLADGTRTSSIRIVTWFGPLQRRYGHRDYDIPIMADDDMPTLDGEPLELGVNLFIVHSDE